MTGILRAIESMLNGEATYGEPKEIKARQAIAWFTVSAADIESFTQGGEFTIRLQILDPDRFGPMLRFERIRKLIAGRMEAIPDLRAGTYNDVLESYALTADVIVR